MNEDHQKNSLFFKVLLGLIPFAAGFLLFFILQPKKTEVAIAKTHAKEERSHKEVETKEVAQKKKASRNKDIQQKKTNKIILDSILPKPNSSMKNLSYEEKVTKTVDTICAQTFDHNPLIKLQFPEGKRKGKLWERFQKQKSRCEKKLNKHRDRLLAFYMEHFDRMEKVHKKYEQVLTGMQSAIIKEARKGLFESKKFEGNPVAKKKAQEMLKLYENIEKAYRHEVPWGITMNEINKILYKKFEDGAEPDEIDSSILDEFEEELEQEREKIKSSY